MPGQCYLLRLNESKVLFRVGISEWPGVLRACCVWGGVGLYHPVDHDRWLGHHAALGSRSCPTSAQAPRSPTLDGGGLLPPCPSGARDTPFTCSPGSDQCPMKAVEDAPFCSPDLEITKTNVSCTQECIFLTFMVISATALSLSEHWLRCSI